MTPFARFGGLKPSQKQIESEVDDELQFHLEQRIAKLEAAGMDPRTAKDEAKKRFGAFDKVRNECIDLTSKRERQKERHTVFAEFGQDFKHALRGLTRQPGFTFAAALTLALGLGASTAIFGLFDAVLLRSLPYERPDDLAMVWTENGTHTMAEFHGLESGSSWQSIDAHDMGTDLTLTGRDRPERLRGVGVTPGMFTTLGVPALAGRLFEERDAIPGTAPVVVLSENAYRVNFGSDPDLLGEEILLDGRSHTVIGVTARGFRFPEGATDLWTPLTRAAPDSSGQYWGSAYLRVVARLRGDVTVEQATAEVRATAAELRVANPVWTPGDDYGVNAGLIPLQEFMAGELKQLLTLLLAAVLTVLLIVCVNMANLLLARGGARERETAIRASLGASRGRLLALQLIESLVLATTGALLGLLPALLLMSWLVNRLPDVGQRFGTVGLDLRVLGFAGCTTVLTALAFGFLPALRASRPDLRPALREGARQNTGVSALVRKTLVTAQVALAVVLVTGAGLLLQSFWGLWKSESGVTAQGILTARLDPAAELYKGAEKQVQYYDAILDATGSLPGVESAATASLLPLDGSPPWLAHRVEGVTNDDSLLPMASTVNVSPDFFRTLGIPMLAGRDFTRGDSIEASGVVVVNRQMADSTWPNSSAIGKRIGYPWPSDWLEVVGVVENVEQQALGSMPQSTIYFPFAQRTSSSASIVINASGNPTSLTKPMIELVRQIDNQVPINDVRTIDEIRWQSVARPRLAAVVVSSFATVALLLGALGIYGVVAFLVEQRRHEIGVRMALGASPRAILRRIVGQSAAFSFFGIAIGLAGGAALHRVLVRFVDQQMSSPWPVLITGSALLAMTAVLASLVPAARAASLDPLDSLREE